MQFPKRVLLLDIETTGLKREQDQIISIGLTYLDNQMKCTTAFWFLENPDEEELLLKRFLNFIAHFDALFTYYGRGFEFPFLLARFEVYHLDASPFLNLKLIDMKNTFKHFAKSRAELESLFGYKRCCSSTGADIVKLYRTYVASQAPIYKDCILAHQEEELESLYCFLELYLTLYETNKWQLISKEVSDCVLTLTIQLPSSFCHTFSANMQEMHLSYIKGESLLSLSIPLVRGSLYHHLEPLKDYFYVPSQKQLMHKSLAQFIPASLKRKATKEECVIYKEDTFIKIYTGYKLTPTLWYDSSQNPYILYTDFTLELLYTQLFYLLFQNKNKGEKS